MGWVYNCISLMCNTLLISNRSIANLSWHLNFVRVENSYGYARSLIFYAIIFIFLMLINCF